MSANSWRGMAVALLGCLLAPPLALAQGSGQSRVAMPEDWSHRHVLPTNVRTRDEAAGRGAGAFAKWVRDMRDPRFARQVVRKTAWAQPTAKNPLSGQQLAWAARFKKPQSAPAHRDWSNVLGGASGDGKPGTFPAKFSFDINQAPDCANDFIVYPTASAGAAGATTFASRTGTFTGTGDSNGTITISRTGAPDLTITSSTTSNLTLNFLTSTNATTRATNLAAAIARNGGTVGVTATSASGTVTVRSLTAGTASNSVTLTDGLNRFSWAGSTLTGGSGTAGQPTIVAFNQLYSSCGTTPTQPVPATFWAYNTGTGAIADLSPVLSLDGTQVAFIQRTSNIASLVLLKWSSAAPGTVGVPTVPASVTAANYRTCTAPCMTTLAFSGNTNDTNSSPFYDYAGDDLYVGDDSGNLHKFANVFLGTPAEVTGGGFPVVVNAGIVLSSPVLSVSDTDVKTLFMGSAINATGTAGGQIHAVDAATGTVTSSGQLGAYKIAANNAIPTGVREAPIVDSAAQRVYAFVDSSIASTCGAECKSVFQLPIPLVAGGSGTQANVGRGQISFRVMYGGTFDDAYYNSADPTLPTGSLYVCGSISDNSSSMRPTIWKIPITSNLMGTPVVGPTLTTATADNCSPITEVKNGIHDYLFVGVGQPTTTTGTKSACNAGNGTCTVYMLDLNGIGTWGTGVVPNSSLTAPGGTSGIVVDNVSTTAGASQVYYSTLGDSTVSNVGNAVQASQAGLK